MVAIRAYKFWGKAQRWGYDSAGRSLYALLRCSPGWNSGASLKSFYRSKISIFNLTGSLINARIAENVASSCLMFVKSVNCFRNSILRASLIYCTCYRFNTKNWNRCNCPILWAQFILRSCESQVFCDYTCTSLLCFDKLVPDSCFPFSKWGEQVVLLTNAEISIIIVFLWHDRKGRTSVTKRPHAPESRSLATIDLDPHPLGLPRGSFRSFFLSRC